MGFSGSISLKDSCLALLAGLLLIWVTTSLQECYRKDSQLGQTNLEDKLPDTLRIVTLFGSTTYFQYRGEDMGYEYELAKLYAEQAGMPIVVKIAPSAEALLQSIDSGYADLCITPQAQTQTANRHYLFVGPEEESGIVLVQPKSDSALCSAAELPGHNVTVPAYTRYAYRLHHLDKELGGGVDSTILYGDTITEEDLIEAVVERSIGCTFADEKLAKLSHTYYHDIDVSVPVGLSQRLSWIVRKDRKQLATSIEEWAKGVPTKNAHRIIYKRYFEESKQSYEGGTEEYNAAPTSHRGSRKIYYKVAGGISPFDELFKKEAPRIGWPWQLLAAIAYHESRFQPDVVGWSGARGLMGIMPATGKIFGASKEELLDPAISIRVSVDCLISTKKALGDLPEREETIKIILAAYNAGAAHLQDAMRLAQKHGQDPYVWEGSVETYLRLKNDPRYYNDPVCKAGYLRGKAVSQYVESVISWYRQHAQ